MVTSYFTNLNVRNSKRVLIAVSPLLLRLVLLVMVVIVKCAHPYVSKSLPQLCATGSLYGCCML